MQQILREHQTYPPNVVASITSWEVWKTPKGKFERPVRLGGTARGCAARGARAGTGHGDSGRTCLCWSPSAAMRKAVCAACRKRSASPCSARTCLTPRPSTLKSSPCATAENWSWKPPTAASSSSAPPMTFKSRRAWTTCGNRKRRPAPTGRTSSIAFTPLRRGRHSDRSPALQSRKAPLP